MSSTHRQSQYTNSGGNGSSYNIVMSNHPAAIDNIRAPQDLVGYSHRIMSNNNDYRGQQPPAKLQSSVTPVKQTSHQAFTLPSNAQIQNSNFATQKSQIAPKNNSAMQPQVLHHQYEQQFQRQAQQQNKPLYPFMMMHGSQDSVYNSIVSGGGEIPSYRASGVAAKNTNQPQNLIASVSRKDINIPDDAGYTNFHQQQPASQVSQRKNVQSEDNTSSRYAVRKTHTGQQEKFQKQIGVPQASSHLTNPHTIKPTTQNSYSHQQYESGPQSSINNYLIQNQNQALYQQLLHNPNTSVQQPSRQTMHQQTTQQEPSLVKPQPTIPVPASSSHKKMKTHEKKTSEQVNSSQVNSQQSKIYIEVDNTSSSQQQPYKLQPQNQIEPQQVKHHSLMQKRHSNSTEDLGSLQQKHEKKKHHHKSKGEGKPVQDKPQQLNGVDIHYKDSRQIPQSYMVTPIGPAAPLVNPGLTRYRSHNRLSQDRISQEFAQISFYPLPQDEQSQSKKKSSDNQTLKGLPTQLSLLDQVSEEKESPQKHQINAGNISPLRRHQRSINTFLDTMKQQYQHTNSQSALANNYQSNNSRHQHQLDLFENLERELKSIIDLFNTERTQKRIESEQLRARINDLEYSLLRQRDQYTQEQITIIERHKAEIEQLQKQYHKTNKENKKAFEKEIKALKQQQNSNVAINDELMQLQDIIKAKDREIEGLKVENESLRRDVQNSYRSNMDHPGRVFKQSFHFNSSNNATGGNGLSLMGPSSSEMYERKISDMQDKIQHLEVKLMESEKRSKKDYKQEIKRLKKQLKLQQNQITQSSEDNFDPKPLKKSHEKRRHSLSQQDQDESNYQIPVDLIKDKIDKMNENLDILEKKYANDPHIHRGKSQIDLIPDNTIKTFIDFEGSSLTNQMSSEDQIGYSNRQPFSVDSFETILDMQNKQPSNEIIVLSHRSSTLKSNNVQVNSSTSNHLSTDREGYRSNSMQKKELMQQANGPQDDIINARQSLQQIRQEIQLIKQNNYVYQKSLKKEIINEIRSQISANSMKFQILEQLVFESNKNVNELKGQLFAERQEMQSIQVAKLHQE